MQSNIRTVFGGNNMKTFKRILSLLLAVAMCIAVPISAFAADTSDNTNEVSEATSNTELNVIGEATFLVSESGITPLSSVSGFNQKTITGGSGTLVVSCNGTGTGGMGITVETYCSYGDYLVDVHGYARHGEASELNTTVCTNNPYKLYNRWQSYLTEYVLEFSAPAGTPDYLVKVWIYG